MNKTTNIMIVGVGGQGTLLASKTLGKLLLSEGYDVKVSEVHGMSQRGGSVVTYVPLFHIWLKIVIHDKKLFGNLFWLITHKRKPIRCIYISPN